jgi:sec-independent protein translocase protein TatA
MAGLTGWHLIIILVVVLLLFGASRLPGLAKAVGQSLRIFKAEMKGPDDPKSGQGASTPGDTEKSTQAESENSADTRPKP